MNRVVGATVFVAAFTACSSLAVALGGREASDASAGQRVSVADTATRAHLTPRQRAVLHRNVRGSAWWAGTVWGVSGRWLAACAASEGGLRASRRVRGAAGEYYWWQFLHSTWVWMRGEALKDARKEHREVPRGYLRIDSPLGQAWVVGWAFTHGYSHHWHGSGC